jgi:hypothetical protein
MTLPSPGTIHPSVFRQGAGFLRWVSATLRPHGAIRYRCPVTGSFVLVTDAAALKRLAQPRARLRCVDCGETHLLAQETAKETAKEDPTAIVASPVTP